MSKLTLSIDANVVDKAKRYARQRGTSISEMVENYLAVVSGEFSLPPNDRAPILRSVRGTLKKADLKDYRRYLSKKYR